MNAAGAWIANAGDNTLVRVDTGTNAVAGTTPVGDGPAAVLATPTALWVANGRDGTVMRLDPRSGKVSKTIRLGGTPERARDCCRARCGSRSRRRLRGHRRRGVSRASRTRDDFASLDPAVELPRFVSYATCANLVTYPDKPAPEGARIVPEVAAAVPSPTAGGTTYTFRIRPGFRFSPPSNEAVTAMTFKSTIERVTDRRLKSFLADQFSGIVGYQAYVTGKAREISGVVARGRTLTIRLSQPDGAFLANLAGGAACAVPRDTPAVAGGINDIPSAGPYYMASYTPRQQLVLRRNPNYKGDRPRHLDRIVVAIGVDPSRALEEIEAGKADYALELPDEAGPRLESAYGPGSKAAKAGHQQYFISEAAGARYLHMNTSRPLFSDVRLRRAVSYAIDRPALVAQGRRFAVGESLQRGLADGRLHPPVDARSHGLSSLPGERARPPASEANRGTRPRDGDHVHAQQLTVARGGGDHPPRPEAAGHRRPGEGVPDRRFLHPYRPTRRAVRPGRLRMGAFRRSSKAHVDLRRPHDRPDEQLNFSYYNDPAFNRKLDAAAKLSGAKRYRAYGRLALELQRDGVPAAPFSTTASRDFFSARIGCQVYQPVFGMDIAALCLRG